MQANIKTEGKFGFLGVLVLTLALIFHFHSLAQDVSIKPEEALQYVGHVKTVCGRVASAHYAASSRGQPTFLNLNKPYPHHVFTVVIWGRDRSKFPTPPESAFRNKDICVTGLITEYQGVPQIVVNEPSQIRVVK